MLNLYKERLLGFIEYRTPAIYHAAGSSFDEVNRLQDRFLNAVNLTKEIAITEFKLAPLNSRRDMGMLGLIHRSVIGQGPSHFQKYFLRAPPQPRLHGREANRNHGRQLISHRKGRFLELVTKSAFGLVDVYNLLLAYVVSAPTVSHFQRRLQEMLVKCIREDVSEWWRMFCPRLPLHNHKLRSWRSWEGDYPNKCDENIVFNDPFEGLDLLNDFFLSR